MSARSLRHPTAALLALSLTACAARAPSIEPRAARAVATLQHDLDAVFDAPGLDRALWGVVAESLDTGDTLFSRHPTTLMMPASNMKILTLAAAAARLGWDYTCVTRLVTTARIDDGILAGDLVLIGGGDPSIGGRVGDEGQVLASWADALWDAGIRVIDGRLVGDDDLFEDDGLGAGWSWEDLALGYAAPVGALTYDENVVELVVRPGDAPGRPAELQLRGSTGGLRITNRAVTGPDGHALSLTLRRPPGSPWLEAHGQVPMGTPEFVRTVSVVNPTDFFLDAFHDALTARGITVTGASVDIDVGTPLPDLSDARVLVTHRSPPLRELAKPLMKVSRNLYGDTLLKILGVEGAGEGTVQAGRQTMLEVLEGFGLQPGSVVISDGSGLSRYNYVTPQAIIAVLRRFADDPWFDAALPIAGRDGTLAGRLQGTAADGNAHAKGGSMSNVRALSGYLRTRDGERLVFAVMANNFGVDGATVDASIDRVIARLAAFSRQAG